MAFSTPVSDQRAFREASPGPRLIVICILSIALMVVDNQNQAMRAVHSMLGTAVYPIRVLIDAPATFGRWLSESFYTRGTLLDENLELNERMARAISRLSANGGPNQLGPTASKQARCFRYCAADSVTSPSSHQ